jgi:tetratricopeptide (TPR) repeat protein
LVLDAHKNLSQNFSTINEGPKEEPKREQKMADFQLIHSQLLLNVPLESLKYPGEASLGSDALQFFALCEPHRLFETFQVKELIARDVQLLYETDDLSKSLNKFVRALSEDRDTSLLVAIGALLIFIQNNYTGPQSPLTSMDYFFQNLEKEKLQESSIQALSSYGQNAYEVCEDPFWLLLSLHLFEVLNNVQSSLLMDRSLSEESISTVIPSDAFGCIVNWWRARALLVQTSLYQEYPGPHIAVVSTLLDVKLLRPISQGLDEKISKDLIIMFHLEKAKTMVECNLEHLAPTELVLAQNLTGFEFVITGARAKRTKFQQTAHSSLIILAKSDYFNNTDKESNEQPENFNLDSDLLLERPLYEDIGKEDPDLQIYKKLRPEEHDVDYSELLPHTLLQEHIPSALRNEDPNEPSNLSDFDNLQLLIRYYTLRATSPSGDPLVEEQLMSLVSRVLYQSSNVNYTIFSRGLWERSILETNKARTIERGILQMQSLVEEIGLKIKARFIPANTSMDQDKEREVKNRIRYVFQLPLLPRWSLDTKLAEKYMSLGIVKSAIEIYERLGLDTEVALCHASIGEEDLAKEIIFKRLQKYPNDARAMSIMGDLTSDPSYWEKAWEIGKYWKAKVSLGKFYYYATAPGIIKDIDLAIKHLHDALTINPLNFDSWFLYGCLGLESAQFQLSAEAFSRCVAIDETSSNAWSNLATSLLRQDKIREAFSALKKATSTSEGRNWRLWENYLIVAAKLGEWDDVLWACKKLIDVKKDSSGEGSVDIPVVEKLVDILVNSEYDDDNLTFFQRSCLEFTTVTLPNVINTSSRLWRIIAGVELWRQRPWASLDCYEKAFRAVFHSPGLETDEKVWNETVDACRDLCAAYESLGEMPGRLGAGDLVCKDWKYKAKQTIKSLMSKGRMSWEDSTGWERLLKTRDGL